MNFGNKLLKITLVVSKAPVKRMNKFLIKKNVQTSLINRLFFVILFIHFPITQKKPIEKPNPSFNLIDVVANKCKWPGSYPPGFMF